MVHVKDGKDTTTFSNHAGVGKIYRTVSGSLYTLMFL